MRKLVYEKMVALSTYGKGIRTRVVRIKISYEM